MKKTFITIIGMLLLVLTAHAAPVPLGIDGYIFDLDNETLADSSVMVSIRNVDSGYFVQGNVRSDGSYAAAVAGNNGDTIIISAWTPYHNTSRQVVLQGVMHNIDLLLNLSAPQGGLEIISEPVIEGTQYRLYLYDVKVQGAKKPKFSLLERPRGMHILKYLGKVFWWPTDAGEVNVTIKVEDNSNVAYQSYNLTILPNNKPGPIPVLPADEIIIGPYVRRLKRPKTILRRPKVVTGLVTFFNEEPASQGIPYVITNLNNNHTVEGETYGNIPAYADVLYGDEGDQVVIEVGEDDYKQTKTTTITGNVVRQDMSLPISESEYSIIQKKANLLPYFIATVLAIK